MTKKSVPRPGWLRTLFQAVWFALTNGYVRGFASGRIYQGETKALCVPGLNCYSCPGAFGACPIGSLQAVLDSGRFLFSCYILGFLMVFGSLLGRFVCGWLCPFGFFQDLLHKIPLPGKRKLLPGHRWLKYLPWMILAVLVILLPALVLNDAGQGKPWFCAYVCPSGTLLAGLPLTAVNVRIRAAAHGLFAWKVFLLVALALLSVQVYRPFCKYLCPLGVLYGLFNPVSFLRFRVEEKECIHCGACQKACGMDIKVWQTPNSRQCIRCGDCRRVCPTGAIKLAGAVGKRI